MYKRVSSRSLVGSGDVHGYVRHIIALQWNCPISDIFLPCMLTSPSLVTLETLIGFKGVGFAQRLASCEEKQYG